MNVLLALVPLVDKTPKPSDVKAGWIALFIFIAMILAVAILGYFLNKQLRTTQRNAAAGAFGEAPHAPEPEPTEGSKEGPE